ncbi:methyltransferase domain-containing protein, partial [Mycena rosella]
PCGTQLQHLLMESEAEYQDNIRHRRAMIRKYGPTPAEVESFPRHGDPCTLWDFFPPAYQCHRVQRLGTLGHGGKYVCGMARIAAKKTCVVYSFGISSDSSFEADVLQRAPGCEVFGCDYSMKSFGPQITANPALAPRAHFVPYALGAVDHALTNRPQIYTLQLLMRMNGHAFIDILKVDIEGSEFKALETFLEAFPSSEVLPFGQLQLEIHAPGGMEYHHFSLFLTWWERLENVGLRPFFSEANPVYVNSMRSKPHLSEYSFINTRGTHALVAD